jgi:glycosyltransferase 2 family protein
VQAALKPAWRWIGRGLVLLSVAFLLWKLSELSSQVRDTAAVQIAPQRWVLSILLYAVAGILLAVAWRAAAAIAGVRLDLRTACAGVLASQIAKYLPGNVAHLLLRHAHARQASGASHAGLARAAGVDAALLVVAGSGLALPVLLASLPWATVPPAAGSSLGTLLGLGLLMLAIRTARLWGALPRTMPLSGELATVAAGTLSYAAFLAVAAVILDGLLPAAAALQDVLPWLALAWIAGFMVPGAPGGLGVREAILGAGLSSLVPPADAYAAAIGLRVVTIAGDGLMGLAGFALTPRP